MSNGRRRSEQVEVTAGMRRAGRWAFLRALAIDDSVVGDAEVGNLDAALDQAFKAMERCRRDELEAKLRRRLGTVHG